jgi:hypothetical protein
MIDVIAERIKERDLQRPLGEMAEKLQAFATELDTVVKQVGGAAEQAVPPEENPPA